MLLQLSVDAGSKCLHATAAAADACDAAATTAATEHVGTCPGAEVCTQHGTARHITSRQGVIVVHSLFPAAAWQL